jgi:sulfide:quinone oxidoreductase
MSNHFQVLIVGGGNAGLGLAAQLLIKKSDLKIGIIEPSTKHYYQPAWTLVAAGEFDIAKTERNEADYIPDGAQWIREAAASFQPESNQVTTDKGNIYSYDYLAVAPGIQLDWDKIKGSKEALGKNQLTSNYLFEVAPYTWEMIKNFKGGVAVFTNPSTPIKCGGAPHKIMYLACDYWSKNGVLDKTEVHYISGATMIFGVPEYKATLEEVLKKYKIRKHYGANVIAVDGENRKLTYTTKDSPFHTPKLDGKSAACFSIAEENSNTDIQTINVDYDFCHIVPPQSAPNFIKQSPLADANNPHGYVEVDKHTFRHIRFSNVFSFGDVSNAPCSKTGAAIRKQTPVVVSHILADMEGKTSDEKYNGYSACPIPTQYDKLMLAEFDYDNKPQMSFPINQAKPQWTMWILKKYVLPWLYWNRILTGKA